MRSSGLVLLVALGSLPLAAQRPGQLFTSPLKDFEVTVPSYMFGTRVVKDRAKDGGFVAFQSDMGDLQRIDYSRLHPDRPAPSAPDSLHAFLGGPVAGILEANRHELLADDSIVVGDVRMRLFVVRFPEGSTLVDARTRKRLDSVRGLLVVTRNGIGYILTVEVLQPTGFDRPGAPAPTDEALIEQARRRTVKFYEAITFKSP
jgi:hypothetical protein